MSGGGELYGPQYHDDNLTAIAALTTMPYGRSLLTLADQGDLMSAIGAGNVGGWGLVELATAAETLPGVDSVRVTTPAGLASSHASLRAQSMLVGGGTVSVNGSGGIAWTARFLAIALGKGTHFSPGGYFDIIMPPNGTVITGVGVSNVTAAGGAILLSSFTALYYILPIGVSTGSNAANFRLVSYTGGDFVIPDNWVLICLRDGDNNQFRWGNGQSMPANAYWTNNDPYTWKYAAKDGVGGAMSGAGSPEGVITSIVGGKWYDTTAGTEWIKKTGSGNTGWVRQLVSDDTLANLISQTRVDNASDVQWKTDFTGTLDTTESNIAEHSVNSVLAGYLNEWGALRGSYPYTTFADALVRGIIPNTGPLYSGQSGNMIEISDRQIAQGSGRTSWGRRWYDGRLMRKDGVVTETYTWKTGDADPTNGGTIPLPAGVTYVFVLATADTLPSWAPNYSIVYRY